MGISKTVVIAFHILCFATKSKCGYPERLSRAVSTVNFNEINKNSISDLEDWPTSKTEEEHNKRYYSKSTQFVEFSPEAETTTKGTPPPPMFILNAQYLKRLEGDEEVTTELNISTTTTTTTEKPIKTKSIRYTPIRREHQRGVLDLLFPSSRVKGFKSVFDTFRRLLSHTFR